jgi:YHS domain-containing protein
MRFLLMAVLVAAMPVSAHGVDKVTAKQHSDSPRSFDTQPAVGTWAKCPVSGDIFQIGKDTEFATYNGRVYAFCCDDCKPDFVKNPAKYADKKKS